ncbi:MAG: hypothetical protein JXA66_08555, partial [Oligoflexia bacterium]|nr:hypothetical protein [Oligoflexia bacterium]
MMVRRIILFSIVFFIILLAGSVYIINSFALNDVLKRFIISQAYYKFNMKVDIENISVSYFYPSVSVSGINIEHKTDKFELELSSKKVRFSFQPLQLFSGRIIVSSIEIDNPKVDFRLYGIPEWKEKERINEKFSMKMLFHKLFKVRIEELRIVDSQVGFRIKDGNKFYTDKADIVIRKGDFLNYLVELNIAKLDKPFGDISNLGVRMDIRDNLVRLLNLEVESGNDRIVVSGNIHNFDEPLKSKLDLRWETFFNLDNLNKFSKLFSFNARVLPRGLLKGKGDFDYDLGKGKASLSVKASFNISNFRHGKISIPSLGIKGTYRPDKLRLREIDISDGARSITVYDTNIDLKGKYPVSGKARVNDVELSRYLELFGIRRCLSYFNINGGMSFTGNIFPVPDISVLVDISASDFWVLLEKGLRPSKANSVIDFKKGKVYGFVRVSPRGAYLDRLFAKSEDNEMYVTGWIREDSTVDIDVTSDSFSIGTYNRIARLPFKGRGSLRTKLRVDDSGAFFATGDLLFSDVVVDKYVMGTVGSEFKFGGVVLSLNKVQGKLGASAYGGNIDIHFDNILKVAGSVAFSNSFVEDVYELFQVEQKSFNYPTGLISGRIKFEGEPDWNGIRMFSNLRLKDLDIFSETFEEMMADFVWDKGTLSVNRAYLLKGKGRIDFTGGRKNKKTDIRILSRNLRLDDFELFSEKDEGLRGKLYL